MINLHQAVTPFLVAEVLRSAGYRAQLAETPSGRQVQSAAQGVGFFVAFGNASPTEEGQYADFSFHCWITIEGDLAPAVVESWNQNKRFARLFRSKQLLVLTQDVLVAGGVSDAHLQAQVEIWDRVIQDFLHHLKRLAPATPTTAGAAA